MSSNWYSWDLDTSSQSAIISAITKGAQVIWGVQSGGATLTAANCSDYANVLLRLLLNGLRITEFMSFP